MNWEAVSAISAALMLLGSVTAWLWSENRKNHADMLIEINKIKNDEQECSIKLNDFKNEVYRNYVPLSGLEAIHKLIDEVKKKIDHLDTKFDDKIDRMSDRRAPRP